MPPAARQSRRNDDGGRSYSSSSQRALFRPKLYFSLINCFLSFSEVEVHPTKGGGLGESRVSSREGEDAPGRRCLKKSWGMVLR